MEGSGIVVVPQRFDCPAPDDSLLSPVAAVDPSGGQDAEHIIMIRPLFETQSTTRTHLNSLRFRYGGTLVVVRTAPVV